MSELEFAIELIGENERLIQREIVKLIENPITEIRVKDAIPFSFSFTQEKSNPSIQEVQIAIYAIENTEVSETYPPSMLLANYIDTENNPNKSLEIRERSQTILPNANSFSHAIVFEYQNTNTPPIQSLEIEIQWFNKARDIIYNETIPLIEAQDPMLRAGQQRIYAKDFQIPLKKSNYKEYKLTILKVK